MTDTATLDRVDPRTLLTDRNIRTHTGLDEDFVESIRQLGVLQRIVVVRTAGGQLRVRMGERRTLGAIKAGRADVPVEIIGDEGQDDAGEIDRRLAQYVENKHRRAMTVADEIRFVQECLELGAGEAEIRERARMPAPDLAAAARAARSKLATAAASRYEFLTLEMAAAIAEFDDDTETVKALAAAARQGQGRFEHVLQQARDDRAARAACAATRAALEADGIPVTQDRPAPPALWLTSLGLAEEDHRDCPGHAAWLRLEHTWADAGEEPGPAAAGCGGDDGGETEEQDGDDGEAGALDLGEDTTRRLARRISRYTCRPVFYCTDPASYGHVTTPPSPAAGPGPASGKSAEEAERETAERRRVLKYNAAWRSAETVRRRWLRDFLARKAVPAGAEAFIYAAVIRGDYELRKAMEGGHEQAAEMLGVPRPAGNPYNDYGVPAAFEAAPPGRAKVIALAAVLAAYESCTGVHTWRNGREKGRWYLAALAGWGYGLSDIEQYVVDGTEF
jgi:ParB family chromosome partitioning protein